MEIKIMTVGFQDKDKAAEVAEIVEQKIADGLAPDGPSKGKVAPRLTEQS